ncbi:hypothetical protein GP486_000006 [Trichoglossum hirsutum]|uniref:Uncharacterized protein n=1 Tax=Trichoglossum hirsutum TaxID=265104 RepID=A0A9P8LJI2_9PEZI|nr:hypothetical protein GP486_000006 [Trichoglossum hirsutum]
MDEVPSSYVFTQEEQADAEKVCQSLKRRQLSRESLTYIHLTVRLGKESSLLAIGIVSVVSQAKQKKQARRLAGLFKTLLALTFDSVNGTSQTKIDAALRSYIAPTKEVNGTGGETGVAKRKTKQKHKKRQKTRVQFELGLQNSYSEDSGIAITYRNTDQDRTSDLELIQRISREIRKGLAATGLKRAFYP